MYHLVKMQVMRKYLIAHDIMGIGSTPVKYLSKKLLDPVAEDGTERPLKLLRHLLGTNTMLIVCLVTGCW